MTIKSQIKAKGGIFFTLGVFVIGLIALLAIMHPSFSEEKKLNKISQTKAIEMLEETFFEPIEKNPELAVTWKGDERFCVIPFTGDKELLKSVIGGIDDIRRAYELQFIIDFRLHVSKCDIFSTDIYILIGPNPGNSVFEEMIDKILGASIPMKRERQLGFSMPFPGHKKRDFIFVASSPYGITHHEINPIAIFREELLHTLASASDVLSKEPLISQLFEVIPPSNSYSDWYKFNPLGWCISDFLLLEVRLGKWKELSKNPSKVRKLFEESFDQVVEKSLERRSLLESFRDDRC